MPTTRRSLGGAGAGSSSSIAGSPRAGTSTPTPATALTSSPRRTTRSSAARSQTPQTSSQLSQSHHHMTADELALREAEEILHHPIVVSDDEELEGHHDLRSRAITPVSDRKKRTPGGKQKARAPNSGLDVADDETEHDLALSAGSPTIAKPSTTPRQRKVSVVIPQADAQSAAATDESTSTPRQEEEDEAQSSEIEEAIEALPMFSSGQIVDQELRVDGEVAGESSLSSSSSSGASSNSDSDSEATDSDTSDSDGESETDSDDEDEEMDALLAKARAAAQQAEQAAKAPLRNDGSISLLAGAAEQEDVLQLGADEDKKDAPIPDMTVPSLPAPHLTFSKDGTAKAASVVPEAGPSRPRQPNQKATRPSDEHGLELDDRPYERTLTKKEKAAQPRKATPSELWATLPSAKSDLLPQMKRDYQALALANSLDPKRFMKGGAKLSKVPETFAIGTLIEPPRRMQDTTLERESRYRPGEIVQGIVADQTTGDYAKRKYGDLQWNRMENGRGKGWKKRSKW